MTTARLSNDTVRHRAPWLTSLLIATGCASAGSGGPVRADSGSLEIPGVGTVETFTPVETLEQTVDATEAEIWPYLPAIFEQLDIEVTEVKEAQRIFGNPRFRPGRIEGERLSRYVDCGRDHGGAYADQHEVWLTFMVQLLRAPDGGTEVSTLLTGSARPRSVNASELPCRSKKVLEARLIELINEQLGD